MDSKITIGSSYFLQAIFTMETISTGLKILHWFSKDLNEHRLIDEIRDSLSSFQDKIMENYLSINRDRVDQSSLIAQETKVTSVLDGLE